MKARILPFSLSILLLLAFTGTAHAKKRRGKLPSDLAAEIHTILQRATQSGEMDVRGTAYFGLGLARPTGVDVSATLKFGLQDPQPEVRLGVIRGMIAYKKGNFDADLVQLIGTRSLSWDNELLPTLHNLPANKAAQYIIDTLNAKGIKDKEGIAKRALEALSLDRVPWDKKTPSLLPLLFKKAANSKGDASALFAGALKTISPKASIEAYPKALRDGSTEMRAAAFENIDRLPPGADLSFIKPLMKSSSPQVSRGAAKLLARQGDASAVPILMPLALGDDVKEQLEALGAIRHAANSSHLRDLEPLRDPTARTAANVLFHVYGAYANAGDRSIAPELRAALRNTDGDYRAAAVRWLGHMEGTRALPDLLEFLKDGNPKVRENAAYAIGELRTMKALPALEKALWDPSPSVKVEVTRAITKLHNNEIIDVIGPLVIEPNTAIQLEIIATLSELKNVSGVAYLLQGLSDRKPEVRTAALKGLMGTDLTTARKKFKQALSWLSNAEIEDMAREMGDNFIPYVRSALEHRNKRVRKAGLNALVHVNAKSRNQFLESLAQGSKYPETKMGALSYLISSRGSKLIPQLAAIISDSGAADTLKVEAVRLLAQTNRKEATELLRSALLEPSEIVRVEAAISLLRLHR